MEKDCVKMGDNNQRKAIMIVKNNSLPPHSYRISLERRTRGFGFIQVEIKGSLNSYLQRFKDHC